jgi:hypothetical protein
MVEPLNSLRSAAPAFIGVGAPVGHAALTPQSNALWQRPVERAGDSCRPYCVRLRMPWGVPEDTVI